MNHSSLKAFWLINSETFQSPESGCSFELARTPLYLQLLLSEAKMHPFCCVHHSTDIHTVRRLGYMSCFSLSCCHLSALYLYSPENTDSGYRQYHKVKGLYPVSRWAKFPSKPYTITSVCLNGLYICITILIEKCFNVWFCNWPTLFRN